jgi:hypothetical protein
MSHQANGREGRPTPAAQIAQSDPHDRLADLRRRRADVVDVLVETLFVRLADAPIGQRPEPARATPEETPSV